jgi:hypothetical protein
MELVASFANRSHLLKAWEKTDICVVSTSGAHGPKNPAITRMPVPRSATESPALFWPHRSRMTLLSATWAHASSFCAPYNSPPVHSIPTMVAALPQAEHDMKRATAPDLENGRNEMDPPLCGSTAMSHNEFTIRELMEPQEASPMKQEMSVLGIDLAKRVFHAIGGSVSIELISLVNTLKFLQ